MTKNKNLKKYSIMFCLAGAIAFAPVNSANAKYHHGDTLVAAAVGGAVAGLVGAVVQNTLPHTQTVIVEPTYVEPAPVVVVREPYYYRPARPIRHVRHYHHRHR